MHTSFGDVCIMPRVTLYVPDDLKARMDEAGADVNWSAVAQRAFMEAVLTHAVRKDDSDMTSVVERLRASKERVEAAELEFGQRCGKKWAKETAEYDELVRIAKFHQTNAEANLATLQQLIDPGGEKTIFEWVDFWRDHGDQEPSDTFASGFIEGAAEIYAEVADQL